MRTEAPPRQRPLRTSNGGHLLECILVSTIIAAGFDVITDEEADFDDDEIEPEIITERRPAVPRFADMITGYATNTGISLFSE